MRTMYDDASAAAGPPEAAAAAGYLRSPFAARAWEPEDWARTEAEVDWLLPIFVCGAPLNDPTGDAQRAAADAAAIGCPKGVVVVLDLEAGLAASAPRETVLVYVRNFAAGIEQAGYLPGVYTSKSVWEWLAPLLAIRYWWVADWPEPGAPYTPHLVPGSAMTQYASLPEWDLSLVADDVPLWPTRKADPVTDTAPAAPTAPTLTSPIVAVAVHAPGVYALVAGDGGIFRFGGFPDLKDGEGRDSLAGVALARPIIAAALTPDGQGLYLVGEDGGVYGFGPSAQFAGSLPGLHIDPAPDVAPA